MCKGERDSVSKSVRESESVFERELGEGMWEGEDVWEKVCEISGEGVHVREHARA